MRYNDDAQDCKNCAPLVDGYRYFFPVLIKFELYGEYEVRSFSTDGQALDSPSKGLMTLGKSYPQPPAVIPGYTYANKYKKTVDGSDPAGASFISGTPSFVYDGNFDTYRLNYYYDKTVVQTDGKVIIKHFDKGCSSLNGISGLQDREQTLKEGMAYSFSHSIPGSEYTYIGYIKTTSGSPPACGTPTAGEYNLGTYTHTATPNPVYLYYYYDGNKSAAGEVNIRHMVRAGPTGTYSLVKQQTVPVGTLPYSNTYSSDATYGNVQGSNLSYISYSDTVTVKTSQSVSLNATTKKAYVTFFYEKTVSFTGDFDVLPDTLPYKASFTLHPKNFQLNGCTYKSHYFKIERNGTWVGSAVNGQTTDSTYNYANYPWVIGVGIHHVSMQIVTSCGTSDWIGPKPLTVTSREINHPPTFMIGFVDPSQPTKPLNRVVEGSTLNLIYINDPTIPTPYDEDGDSLYFMGFDFWAGSSFVQSIPSKSVEYGDGQHNLTMDTLGFHSVCAQMRDEFGATATACTYIQVVPKNPVPVIECPPSVIANHPIAAGAINGNRSYSPISYRTIDRTRDEWTNKQTSYPNPGTTDISVTVSLDVYDNTGLKSLEPDKCIIIVKPDLPPVAKLVVPPLSVRGTELDLLNKSYSPDGDAIVSAEYKYKYDANNNGFADDPWKALTGTLSKLQFTPKKVGKYLFYLKVTEEYGQWDDTNSDPPASLTLNVVNNAPTVSFDLEGKNPQPDLDPYTRIQAEDMIKWPIYEPGTNSLVNSNANLWRTSAGNLISGEGRNFGQQFAEVYHYNQTRFSRAQSSFQAYQLSNNGFGSNELNPWRSTLQSTVVANLLNPAGNRLETWYQDPPKIRSTKKLLLYDKHDRTSRYDCDSTGYCIVNYYYDDSIVALDPQKLSAVKDIFGNWGSVSQAYTKGNPNVYVIRNSGSRYVDLLLSGQVQKNVYVYMNDMPTYEVADQYLYIKRNWNYAGRNWVSDIGVFDVRTGKELTSTFSNLTIDQYKTSISSMNFCGVQGSSVILCGSTGYYKLTRDMDLISIAPSSGTAPAPRDPMILASKTEPWYYGGLSNWMTAADGSRYRYEGYMNQNYGAGIYDLNVTKYNSDFTLAWRQYIGESIRDDAAVQGRNMGITPANSFISAYSYPETYGGFFFNPAKNELYAKVYYDHYNKGDYFPNMYERVYVFNATSGTALRKADSLFGDQLTLYHYGGSDYGAATQFSTDFAGNITKKSRLSQTADGYRTSLDRSNGATCDAGGSTMYSIYGRNTVFDQAGNPAGKVLTGCNYSPSPYYGAYYMDGVYVTLSQATPTTSSDYGTYSDQLRMTVSVGQPTTNPLIIKSFTSGQFYSPNTLSDVEMKFSFKMDDTDYDDEWLGFSFRMKDQKNGYALETDAKQIQLALYRNGVRTVIQSLDYPLISQKTYAVKLQMSGSHIAVFLDNTPLMEVEDDTYSSGHFGYFSNKAFIIFSGLAYKPIVNIDAWSDQYAIWDEGKASAEIQYKNIVFDDPENDPPAGGMYDWSVKHTVRFIHNQGLSELDGKTFHDAQLGFDKVGDYVVSLKAKDDPNPKYLYPDTTFDEYRKSSNEFTQKITVHRRPVAKFKLSIGSDYKVNWTDYSYDPDRYFSSTDYSTEDTGIDYKATRGILQKKFYYTSPSGVYRDIKLVTPTETGIYEVGLAVQDEYGAWSNWYIVMLDVAKLPAPNNPPVPGFTATPTTTFRGVPITFNSTAYDVEDGDRTQLPHEYYIKNVTTGGTESLQSTSRTSWMKSFNSLGTFNVRQVVTDSEGASAAFSKQVTIVNQAPSATITVPTSSDPNNPTKLTVLRPDFQWSYSDPDGDVQTQYQMKIYRYGGVIQHDSGIKVTSDEHWTPGVDLPEKVNMYVIVRVFDGYDWSEYSAPKYFYIETNLPPTGDFDWMPKPVYEGDTVKISQTVDDPDKDLLIVSYTVKDPDGSVTSYSYSLNQPYDTVGPSFKGTRPGVYTVRMTVSDGKAAPVVVTKNVILLPLSISGLVKHTDLWNERRIESNIKSSGNADRPRGYNVFWAGERFLLIASTTDTATATVANEVKVTLNGLTISLSPKDAARTSWNGDMWAADFEKLPDGPLTFTFKVVYSNGTVKTTTVTVMISGNVQQTVGVHRRQ